MTSSRSKRLVSFAVTLLVLPAVHADTLTIPGGTEILGELEERVTSRKKETALGDYKRARVWRDVRVGGQTAIEAGAPMVVRVSHLKKARIAGRKGQLQLEAVSVRAVDGTDVMLDGGYDKSGKGRKTLSISLAVLAWPVIFLKGKQAVLDSGTVFDATVQGDSRIEIEGARPVRVDLRSEPALTITILYEEMDPEGKDKTLPMLLRRCDGDIEMAAVITVNEQQITQIPITLGSSVREDECMLSRAHLDLQQLSKYFTRGINRFEIEVPGARAEVILEIEL